MLKEILEKADDDLIVHSEQYRKYSISHSDNFKIEFENYFATTNKGILSIVSDYIKIYQLFGYKEDEISTFIREKLTTFYLLNISNFIVEKEEFAIYSFIDIFYCDPLFFKNKEILKTIFKVTYPILFLETEDMSSFIAIASMRYIAILGSENEGKVYLNRYLYENKNGIYIEDIKEEL